MSLRTRQGDSHPPKATGACTIAQPATPATAAQCSARTSPTAETPQRCPHLRARGAQRALRIVENVALRDVFDVRTTGRRYVIDVLAAMPTPARGRTLRVGLDPIRILLIGAGTAAGYGVTDSAHALDGALADAVHLATGRGVVLENRTTPNVPINEVRASLGASGAHTFDVVVWAPTYLQVVERLSTNSWRRALTTLVDDLHADSDVDVVLLLLPHTTGRSPVAALARRWVPRINRVIEQVAAATERTSSAETAPAYMAAVGEVVLDRDYYARCAECILPAVLQLQRGR